MLRPTPSLVLAGCLLASACVVYDTPELAGPIAPPAPTIPGGDQPTPTTPPADPTPPIPPTVPPTPPPTGGLAAAFGLWNPGPHDSCTKDQHDAYSVIGPDGKRYPTWHPPVDPSGCTFGHEHGKDPRGSDLYAEIGDIPFGLANEALLEFPGFLPRNEDHFGHKVEWVNDAVFSGAGATRTCDVLVKNHQGTHSPDAFANNVHETAYHLRCDDGAVIHFTALVSVGSGGTMLETCTSQSVATGTPNPADSPGGVGSRTIPTRFCTDDRIAGVRGWSTWHHVFTENWAVDPLARRADGTVLARIAMYAMASDPSRYFDPARTNKLARSVEVCYETDIANDGRNLGPCLEARSHGTVAWDHPDSPFRGAVRSVHFNQIQLSNAGQPEVWYTNPFGGGGRTEPFPGSIRQFFSAMNNDGLRVTGPRIGGDYTAHGVHAPN